MTTPLNLLILEDSQAEERYRALFDRSLDCVFLNDFEGKFLDANQAALDLLGYRREDIPTLNFASLLTEDQLPLAFQVTEEIKKTGYQKQPTEYRLRCKDGSQVYVETQSSLICRAGKPFAIQGIARDLTERRRAQDLLFASEQRLNAFFTKAPAGLVLLDKQLRYVQLNETVTEINGVPMRDHLGKTVWEVLPKLAPVAEPLLQKVLATGERMLNIELSGETPSQPGVLRHWLESFFPVMGKDGRPEGVGVIFVEITERKRAEERMHLQSSALTAVDNAILITDPNGTIEWVNPSFTRLTGYNAEEAVGNKPGFLNSGQQPPTFFANLWTTITTGNVWHGELVNQRKDGKLYTEEMTITPVRGADGQIAHFVAIKQDVTERRSARESVAASAKDGGHRDSGRRHRP